MDHQPQSASWWSSGPQKFERCTSSYSSNHQQDLSGSFTSVKDPPQIQDKMDRKLTKLGVSTLLLSTVLFFMAGLPTPKKTKLIAQCSNPFDIEWNPGLIRDGILISWLYEIIPTAYVAPDPCFITYTHSQQRRSTGHCSIIKIHSLKLNKTALKTKTSHPKRTFHLPTHWFSRSQLAIISFWEGVFAMVLLHPRSLTAHPWKRVGWKTILSYWVSVTFQGLHSCKLANRHQKSTILNVFTRISMGIFMGELEGISSYPPGAPFKKGLKIGCAGGKRGSMGRCSKTWSRRKPSSSVWSKWWVGGLNSPTHPWKKCASRQIGANFSSRIGGGVFLFETTT